jgi:hypothetical protein
MSECDSPRERRRRREFPNTTLGTVARTETPTTRPLARTPRRLIYIHRPCDVEAHEYKAPDAYLKAARDESSPLANANNLASSLSRTLIAHQCRSRVTDAHLHRVRASATCSRITSASRARNRARKHRIRPARVARASTQPPRIASSSFVVKPRPFNRMCTRASDLLPRNYRHHLHLARTPNHARARRRYTHRNTRATRNRESHHDATTRTSKK